MAKYSRFDADNKKKKKDKYRADYKRTEKKENDKRKHLMFSINASRET